MASRETKQGIEAFQLVTLHLLKDLKDELVDISERYFYDIFLRRKCISCNPFYELVIGADESYDVVVSFVRIQLTGKVEILWQEGQQIFRWGEPMMQWGPSSWSIVADIHDPDWLKKTAIAITLLPRWRYHNAHI